MFHCNGWCFPWTIAMQAGTHVCLRKVEAKPILDAMRSHKVDHYCAAPIVHSLIYNASEEMRAGISQKVRGMVAGAAPPAAMIEGMANIGFEITHVYGLTEVYGPASVAVKRSSWAADSARSRNHAGMPRRWQYHGGDHVQGQYCHEGLP
jgi:fatty-acyl-CoA synthase